MISMDTIHAQEKKGTTVMDANAMEFIHLNVHLCT
jgi:hypothetical protein